MTKWIFCIRHCYACNVELSSYEDRFCDCCAEELDKEYSK